MMYISTMEQAFSLMGRSAIVTGGNRGIGLGIARAFAHQGANVAIFCRDEESAAKTVEEFSEKYLGKYAYYITDVTNFENCKDSVNRAVIDFRGIDILVNNAGVNTAGKLLDMDEDLSPWFESFDINLNSAVRMTYLVGKHMRERGGGKIINISSTIGEMMSGDETLTPYSCAKAALNRLTRCLGYELGKNNIRVNAIAPGYTETDMTLEVPKEVSEAIIERTPVGRSGHTIDTGALAVYLASDAADYMTGAVITLDGGYSLAL